MKPQRAARFWDLCAAGLSSACILHCLGFPLLAAALPVASLATDDHLLHIIMVMAAAPVTLWVVWSERANGNTGPFVTVALTGLAMMIAEVSIPAFKDIEVALTVCGGALVGGAHLWRWLGHRQHAHRVTHQDR